VNRWSRDSWAAVNGIFADACNEAGLPWSDDLNNADSDAGVVGAMPHNCFKEVEQGTLGTYLRFARGRKNLTIRGSALVDRILIENGRAKGVSRLGSRKRGPTHRPCGRRLQHPGGPDAIGHRGGRAARRTRGQDASGPACRPPPDRSSGMRLLFSADAGKAMTGRLFATILRDSSRDDAAAIATDQVGNASLKAAPTSRPNNRLRLLGQLTPTVLNPSIRVATP
jgi:hypothetical protein